MEKIVLSLGSNLGDRLENLKKALNFLKLRLDIENIEISSIYETSALLKENSPQDWNLNYYNLAICGECRLEPLIILKIIKEIESQMGRNLDSLPWSPRVIDIDILAYGLTIYYKQELKIPHQELLNRKWCVLPFAEIYPEWKYVKPGKFYNRSIAELALELKFKDELFKKIASGAELCL